jgi:hypothetical protein
MEFFFLLVDSAQLELYTNNFGGNKVEEKLQQDV